MKTTISLNISDDAWEPCGEEEDDGGKESCLGLQLDINGVSHFLHAIQIMEDEERCQDPVESAYENMLDHFREACADYDRPYRLMTINGKTYAVFMTPFCN